MIRKLLLLLLISFVPFATHAHDHDTRSYIDKHFDVSGYVGYQFVYGSPEPEPVESSPEVGLLINYDISSEWMAFTQFRLDTEHMEQSVAYAFVEYDSVIADVVPIELTAGKLRHHYGLYNKDRLNPRTRPGNVAPQAMYWDQLRYALTSGWGVAVGTSYENWSFKYTITTPIVVDKKEESVIWFSGRPIEVETKFGGHQLINIDYIRDDWRVVTAITLQDWGHGAAGKNYIVSLGGEKRFGDVTLSLEGMAVMKYLNTSYGISATAQYDVSDLISVHANYNRYEAIFKDDAIAAMRTPHTIMSNDASVGITIHRDQWEVKTEYHVAKGSIWIDYKTASNPEFADLWHYGAVSVVYHF